MMQDGNLWTFLTSARFSWAICGRLKLMNRKIALSLSKLCGSEISFYFFTETRFSLPMTVRILLTVTPHHYCTTVASTVSPLSPLSPLPPLSPLSLSPLSPCHRCHPDYKHCHYKHCHYKHYHYSTSTVTTSTVTTNTVTIVTTVTILSENETVQDRP
jgi:hypothetical protein